MIATVWARLASCLVAGAAAGCLSSPPGAIGGGGDGGDPGDGDGGDELGPCPESREYFGGAGGLIDGDDRDDLVLLAGKSGDGTVEFRLSSMDLEPRCLGLGDFLPRGAVVGDLVASLDRSEAFVLAFDGVGARQGLMFSTETGAPELVDKPAMGVDDRFTIYDPMAFHAAQGDRGWFFAYGERRASVSSPFTGDLEGLEWHELRDVGGSALTEVKSIALQPLLDDVLLFAATEDRVAWYDTSELPAVGPIEAKADVPVVPALVAVGFADLDPSDNDACPDMLGVRPDPKSAYQVIHWRDTVCTDGAVFGLEDGFSPAIATETETVLSMTTAQLDPGELPDLVFSVLSDGDRVMRGMREARVDEVEGRECGLEDAVVEACAETAEELPSSLRSNGVSAIRFDQDGDGQEDVLLVDGDGTISCYQIVAGDWQACP